MGKKRIEKKRDFVPDGVGIGSKSTDVVLQCLLNAVFLDFFTKGFAIYSEGLGSFCFITVKLL